MGRTEWEKEGIVHIENLVKRYLTPVVPGRSEPGYYGGGDFRILGLKPFRKNNSHQLYAGAFKI